MKKSSLILAVVFLVSLCGSYTSLSAQDKTETQKEKDKRIQEEIDAQKKALVEKQKAQDEAKKAMDEAQVQQQKAMKEAQMAQKKALEALKEYQFDVQVSDMDSMHLGRIYEPFMRMNRPFRNGEVYAITPDANWIGHWGDDSERTSWDFTKSVKETTFSRDYTFDVEPSASTVVMAVNGDCKSGEIRIKIVMPNGKTYSDIVIDEFGNLNWRKSFNISEDENKDKTGAWKFEINSSKATGYFKISLQTY